MRNQSKPTEVTLPARLQVENAWLVLGSLFSYLLLPIFIYNISKNARNAKIVMPAKLSFVAFLEGYSCASICHNALWQYGIPAHVCHLQFVIHDGKLGLACSVLVPHTRIWEADIHLRQWERQGLNFVVESPVRYKDGYSSLRYADKLYEPIGVYAKKHSVDMMMGMGLFGWTLNTKAVQYNSTKTKKDGENIQEIKINKIEHDKPKQNKVPSHKKQTKVPSHKKQTKLGKTYKRK